MKKDIMQVNIMKHHKDKSMSTYDELMQDPDFKKSHEASYQELVLSELLLAIMAEDNVSIRSLAKQAGLSPAIIQDIRSGKRDNLTLKTFTSLLDALGYHLIVEKKVKIRGQKRRFKMESAGERRISKRKRASSKNALT